MNYYEFTGETMAYAGTELQRIRATKPLPRFGVAVGDVGGWVESEANLSDNAWVSGNARVFDNARVFGDAWVFANAWVFDNAQVFDNARVFGDARVSDNARVFGDAQVFGDAWVFGDARVSDNARVFGDAQVFGDAWVRHQQHTLTIGPVGSESVTATVFRTINGHALRVGCWTGTVDGLAAEVERRSKNWRVDEPTAARWRAEYAALETLVRARITGWHTDD